MKREQIIFQKLEEDMESRLESYYNTFADWKEDLVEGKMIDVNFHCILIMSQGLC